MWNWKTFYKVYYINYITQIKYKLPTYIILNGMLRCDTVVPEKIRKLRPCYIQGKDFILRRIHFL